MKTSALVLVCATVLLIGAGCAPTHQQISVASPTPQQVSATAPPPTDDAAPEPGTVTLIRTGPAGWRAYEVVIDPPDTRLVVEGPNSYRTSFENGEPIGFSPAGDRLLFIGRSDVGLMSVFVLMIAPVGKPKQLTNTDPSIQSAGNPMYVPIPLSPDDVTWTGVFARYSTVDIPGKTTIVINTTSGAVTYE